MATRSEWLIDKSEAVGTGGMVTAMQPLAAEAGAAVLKKGGNAIDAAVAIGFAIGVVEPFMSGLGGIAFMVYRDAKTGQTICLDGSAILPRAITPEHFELLDPSMKGGMYGWRATKNDANNTGWLAPAVPGMPDLFWQAHQRYGSLPWSQLLEPAIELAENGFDVNHYISLMMAGNYDRLSLFPESRKTFIRASGAPYTPSAGGRAEGGGDDDLLRQPDLARTLKLIADQGAEVFYRGEIAKMIADDMAANGGLITMEDLDAHRTVIREPGSITYRGHQILAQLENTGNPTVLEALNILEGFDIGSLEYQSPEAVHLIVEAMRRSFRDRLRHLGDVELMDVPMQGLLSAAYAAERRATIDPTRATPDIDAGDPWPFNNANGAAAARDGHINDGHTTHINVIDKDRNMVSVTSTLGQLFGSGVVIKGTGITLNNATTWFDPVPGAVASIGPGKRTMSAASPVLVLKDGAPYAAIGSPGGRRVITAIYQILVNLLDFGKSIQPSISAPRTHTEGPLTEISTRFPSATIEGLEAMGHKIARREDTLAATSFARPSGIIIDGDELRAGVHQYTPATAIGID